MALPTPTAAASITPYSPLGKRKVVWVATIANILVPTSAEITAGTDVSPWVIPDGLSGFSSSSNFNEAPNLANRFAPKVAGSITVEDSSIRFNAATSSTDVRQLLTRDLTGYIFIAWEGIVTGGKCSIFPVTVGSSAEENGTDPASIMVAFAVTGVPAEQIAIPIV